MKPSIHTKEWLFWARERAGLSRKALSELSGLGFSTIQALEEGIRGGSPETWAKLDMALYPLVPAAYVDEGDLLELVRKRGKRSEGRAKCRLYYVAGGEGVAFTNVLPEGDESLPGAHIVVTWAEAEALLEVQKAAFE